LDFPRSFFSRLSIADRIDSEEGAVDERDFSVRLAAAKCRRISAVTKAGNNPLRVRSRLGGCLFALLLIPAAQVCGAQSAAPVIESANGPNAPVQQSKPYVVVVSLDGFRYDYAARYGAKNLLAMVRRGASAPGGMLPAFPSLTFPNHYSIATGLYPEHHGIVANFFYDPARKQSYAFNDPKSEQDGSWYGGTPLWVLSEQQSMRSATFFWPGSEAEIRGKRPSYYLHYDDKFPDDKRVDQVLSWLRLPADRRPHLIFLYYSNVDHAGHEFGPDSPETAKAVRHVDELIGRLVAGLRALNLPVDLFVVSDHGMASPQGDWIILDHFADLSHFRTAGPLLYADSEADAEKAYRELRGASDRFEVYRRESVPPRLHFNSNPRSGDPVVVPTGPYYVRSHEATSFGDPRTILRGVHGYDPYTMASMKAIFYAAGPDIRAGVRVTPFENIDLYPLIAKILGLRTGSIDGKLAVLEGILKQGTSRGVSVGGGIHAAETLRFDFSRPSP
jgi:predicted AlkP superfamily pyrophosphatase or phosphodiesterase